MGYTIVGVVGSKRENVNTILAKDVLLKHNLRGDVAPLSTTERWALPHDRPEFN